MTTAALRAARWVVTLVDGLALLAPALGVTLASTRSGLDSTTNADLVVASAVLALGHAAVTAHRLGVGTGRPPDRGTWLATTDGVIVLAVAASSIVASTLYYQAVPVRRVVDAGMPIVVVWFSLLLAAVALAELTRLLVRWWLRPRTADEQAAMFGPGR